MTVPRPAFLVLDGWGGRFNEPVFVVDSTPKRYRIIALTRVRLGGRNRWLEVGRTVLVPKTAVRFP
jgi:hypothetical protein